MCGSEYVLFGLCVWLVLVCVCVYYRVSKDEQTLGCMARFLVGCVCAGVEAAGWWYCGN